MNSIKTELLEKLEWLAAKHITREYRTSIINEDDAKQILAALQAVARRSELAVDDVTLADIIQNETGCADSDSLSAAWAVQEAYYKARAALAKAAP